MAKIGKFNIGRPTLRDLLDTCILQTACESIYKESDGSIVW